MDSTEKLLKATVAELEKLLNARNVLGEPIERDGATVIPIVSYGFGFGAGGNGDTKGDAAAFSGGAGAGGGIKPMGAIVMDQHGARVEIAKAPAASWVEVVGEAAAQAIRAASDRGKAAPGKTDTAEG